VVLGGQKTIRFQKKFKESDTDTLEINAIRNRD
jgi:hypothetical protein